MEKYHGVIGLMRERKYQTADLKSVHNVEITKDEQFEARIGVALDFASNHKRRLIVAGLGLISAAGMTYAGILSWFISNNPQSEVVTVTNTESGKRGFNEFYGNEDVPYAQILLESPGLYGLEDKSFLDKMKSEGYSFHWFPLLGNAKITRVASAGAVGSHVRSMPHPDEKRFEVRYSLPAGECFRWKGPEGLLVSPDGAVQAFAVNPEGFISLNKSPRGTVTDWHVNMNDPKCKILTDEAVVYDAQRGVIGPSQADQDRFK